MNKKTILVLFSLLLVMTGKTTALFMPPDILSGILGNTNTWLDENPNTPESITVLDLIWDDLSQVTMPPGQGASCNVPIDCGAAIKFCYDDILIEFRWNCEGNVFKRCMIQSTPNVLEDCDDSNKVCVRIDSDGNPDPHCQEVRDGSPCEDDKDCGLVITCEEDNLKKIWDCRENKCSSVNRLITPCGADGGYCIMMDSEGNINPHCEYTSGDDVVCCCKDNDECGNACMPAILDDDLKFTCTNTADYEVKGGYSTCNPNPCVRDGCENDVDCEIIYEECEKDEEQRWWIVRKGEKCTDEECLGDDPWIARIACATDEVCRFLECVPRPECEAGNCIYCRVEECEGAGCRLEGGNCVEPLGDPYACCFEDGRCSLEPSSPACTDSGGVEWLWGQGECDPNPCPQPCAVGNCAACTEEECEEVGCHLEYDPDNPDMGGFCVEPAELPPEVLRACCYDDGDCSLLSESNCVGFGGDWLSDEEDCDDPNLCPSSIVDPVV